MSAQIRTGPHWDHTEKSYYIAWFNQAGHLICKDYNLPNADLPGFEETLSHAPSHDFSSIGPAGNATDGGSVESTCTAFDQYDPTCYTNMDLFTQQGQDSSQQSALQGLIMPPGIQPIDVEFANNLYDTNNQSVHADTFMSMDPSGSQDQQDVWLFDPAFTSELP
jgi:hypothetical protein